MTETVWLETRDHPRDMLEHLEDRVSRRKWRLFLCACVRPLWYLFTDDRSRAAVDLAERYADGLADEADMAAARKAAVRVQQKQGQGTWQANAAWAAQLVHYRDDVHAFEATVFLVDAAASTAEPAAQYVAQCDYLRCIFGNPFRPLTLDPAWLTPAVLGLARLIYNEKNFSSMPVLGAALSDAGCTDAGVLGHCVAETHVRGCHLIDFLLNKT